MNKISQEIIKRRTFAIISHPDAGKTTMTEMLLLHGGAIYTAGTVKGRKVKKMATSDWMALEQQRGISVTTSVMQFTYRDRMINLLDTPGHEDFSEDTYRTLTAVDSALMIIDGIKGVENKTKKLMNICRIRKMPIITFINKFDRECRSPFQLLDEIESVLNINCVPMMWPIGCGKHFLGIYHLIDDRIYLYDKNRDHGITGLKTCLGLHHQKLIDYLGKREHLQLVEDIMLAQEGYQNFDQEKMLSGQITPVYFGSALNNFGVQQVLDALADFAPMPGSRQTQSREIMPDENQLTGVVFKIQANMDPNHRDRIAFMRICSGQYKKGIHLFHVRVKKILQSVNAFTFMAGNRKQIEKAYAGDIIGLHNHGTIKIGDAFSEGENLIFTGIPFFAPELFQSVQTADPLKAKALQKGLIQLSEEGAIQVIRPLKDNRIILGAIGTLQFDVVKHRLKNEYGVDCIYVSYNITTIRWIECHDEKIKNAFKVKYHEYLAYDNEGMLVYLAPTWINLQMTIERCPDISFYETREIQL